MVNSNTAFGTVGVPFSFFLVFDPGPIFYYSTDPLPDGLFLDFATGEIYGSPTTPGFSPTFVNAENTCQSSGDIVTFIISSGGGGGSSSGGGY